MIINYNNYNKWNKQNLKIRLNKITKLNSNGIRLNATNTGKKINKIKAQI